MPLHAHKLHSLTDRHHSGVVKSTIRGYKSSILPYNRNTQVTVISRIGKAPRPPTSISQARKAASPIFRNIAPHHNPQLPSWPSASDSATNESSSHRQEVPKLASAVELRSPRLQHQHVISTPINPILPSSSAPEVCRQHCHLFRQLTGKFHR